MSIPHKIFFFFLFIFSVQYGKAQPGRPPADTLRTIEILKARNQRQITVDSVTVLQTLSGDASVKQAGTILSGDSIILNQLSGVAEVFGNVHINDGDTVNTYSQYLKYVGNDRMAYLKKNVKLSDGKATLTTEELEYNLATGIANYENGGKVVNDKTVLTSEAATYYSETKDVFFKNNVHLVDPKYNITADSLRYNTAFKTAYFIAPTHIVSKDGIIDTKSGTYNLETGNAIFDSRSSFRDSTSFLSGDKIAFEEKTGVIQIEGRGKFVDSAHNVIVLGNQLLIDKKNSTFLATRKPVMILFRDGDSTYVSADTLFSGIRKYDTIKTKDPPEEIKKDSVLPVTLSKPATISNTVKDTLRLDSALTALTKNELPKQDSVGRLVHSAATTDSVNGSVLQHNNLSKDNNVLSKQEPVSVNKTVQPDSENILKNKAVVSSADTIRSKKMNQQNDHLSARKKNVPVINQNKKSDQQTVPELTDTLPRNSFTTDTLKEATAVNIDHISKDSIRYFLGFHHVKIYNDSLQAVSDSMYYSTEDSTFTLFGNPVFWNDSTQVKGDTMHLYTANQKAKRLYVYYNGIVVNRTREGLYNQMGGRTINGFFKDGNIDYIRVKGSPAESVFFPQNEDSAYVGMNRSKGDVIDIFFIKKELNKIKFINDVDGTLFPMKQIPKDQKFLKNFTWEDKRRPKSKLELFE